MLLLGCNIQIVTLPSYNVLTRDSVSFYQALYKKEHKEAQKAAIYKSVAICNFLIF